MSEQHREAAPLDFSHDEFDGAHRHQQQLQTSESHLPLRLAQQHSQHSQQQQQRHDSDYAVALEQARRVLDATNNLDGFNLLGVVANPRGPNQNYHNRRPHVMPMSGAGSTASGAGNGSSVSTTGDYGSGLEDTMMALESTLAGVTEQIDAMNQVLDQWSRHYLGTLYDDDDYTNYRPPDEAMSAQITELPEELSTLSLQSVQDYLTHAGVLAHALDERRRNLQQQQQQQQHQYQQNRDSNHEWHEAIVPNSDVGDLVDENEEDFMLDLEEQIPSRFFETYFDLTDRNTFSELLVLEQDTDMSMVTTNQSIGSGGGEPIVESNKKEVFTDGSSFVERLPSCLSESTHDILRLPPADAFSTYLDKVEIALLQQVRNKSIAFFHETNRFGQLKEWITGLVEEVERVRKLLSSVADKSVVAWELIPLLDKQRQDLIVLNKVLESAHDAIRCKSCISGLLSANDDLGAAEQIQYGRNLLQQDNLHKLVALKTINDQLTQYETLVVANLGEELVEILLDWNSFSKTSAFPRIPDMVRGLQLCHSLDKVAQLYGSRLLDVIRMTVRTTVGEFADEADSSVKACVTSMTLERFVDCLDMLFEQVFEILKSAVGVQEFGNVEGVDFSTNTLPAAAELSSKSISELLRLRKEAHSLVTLEEMRRLWDVCIQFTVELEKLSDYKATALRSTLLAQAKAFVERQHESNMSSLVAALDSERWTQCDVSSERQGALTRLCSGRAVAVTRRQGGIETSTKSPEAEVEGVRCKVVWSCLLLVEMIMNNIACAVQFQSLATNIVGKVAELLRLFNSRSTQLVLGAGAIHSAARLKSINAKHLSLVTQCLGVIIAILPHVRAALMAQLPSKQHGLLQDLDKIKKEYEDHLEKVLNKFVTIIGGIVEHSLAPRILGTNFDARIDDNSSCVFLEGVATNTRKMHQVLSSLLPPDHLQDVFSRIFSFLDQKVPALFFASATPNSNNQGAFYFPTTDPGKRQMLVEVERMTTSLNSLAGVRPWEFTVMRVLERHLDYELHPEPVGNNGQIDDDTTAVENNPENENSNGGGMPNGGDIVKDIEPPTTEQPQHEANGSVTSEEPDNVHGENQDDGALAGEPIGVGTF